MTDYSHSRLSKFEQCRFLYKLEYIDGIKIKRKTIEQFLGTSVHDTLEMFHNNANHGKIETIDGVCAYYHMVWDQQWTDDILIVNASYTKDHYRMRGEQYIRDYYQRFANGDLDSLNIVSIEQTNKMGITPENRYYVKIDKLCCNGGTYFVCDYKTSVEMLTLEKAKMDRQLAMYALWVYETYPDVQKVVQRWHMLHFGKDVDVDHTREELESIKAKVAEQIVKIEQCTDFPTNRTRLCDYCAYQMMCPEFKHLHQIESLPKEDVCEDDGVRLVDELAATEAMKRQAEIRIDELKEDIIQYHKRFGVDAIYGRDKMAKISTSETVVLPKDFTKFLAQNHLLDKYGQVSFSRVKTEVLSGRAEPNVQAAVKICSETKVSIRKRYSTDNDEVSGDK